MISGYLLKGLHLLTPNVVSLKLATPRCFSNGKEVHLVASEADTTGECGTSTKIFGILRSSPSDGEHNSPHLSLIPWLRVGLDDVCCQFPINLLPPELLADVFFWYIMCVHQARMTTLEGTPTPYCWLVVSHVCRLWRSIALEYPHLSTHICLTRPSCVMEMVSRSGNLPLHIHGFSTIIPDASDMDEMPQFLSGLVPRITTLNLSIVHGSFTSLIYHEASRYGMVEIQTLALRKWLGFSFHDLDTPFFHGKIPSLLNDISFSFGHISSLEHMLRPGVRRLSILWPHRISTDHLIAVLASLQELEELALQEACSEPFLSSDLTNTSSSTITLPHLRSLTLQDYGSDDVIQVLRRVLYPATAAVNLQLRGSNEPEQDLHDIILSVVSSKINGEGIIGTPRSPQSIAVEGGAHYSLNLVLWEHRQSIDDLRTASSGSAYFRFSIQYASCGWVSQLMRSISQQLAHVRTMLLTQNIISLGPFHRAHIVTLLPSLQELVLMYECNDYMDESSDIFGPSDSNDDFSHKLEDLDLVFPYLEEVLIFEYYHRYPFKDTRQSSDVCRLARRIESMHAKEGSPFFDVIVSIESSSFHYNLLCLCSPPTSPDPVDPNTTKDAVSRSASRFRRFLKRK